ncbi:MAG: DUF5697 family protein [Clostridiaceae bacterium]|nr:DUF5697 family protein [Clostridiaceae bacterium]
MRTRDEIYGQEATGLLRDIAMYPGLRSEQLCRFYPSKKDKILKLLTHLCKQGRVGQSEDGAYFLRGADSQNIDTGLVRAVWVLLDFIERVEYHSASDFPVKLIFFIDGELYEVVYAASGQEALVAHILSGKASENSGRRIVLVDIPEQIGLIQISGVSGYCTVNEAGKISYYKKEGGT